MKKRFIFLFIIFLLFPTLVFASRYDLEGTDLSLLLDDDSWYVFTRGNIEGNEELEELGVSYDYLSNLMEKNFIYLDAVHFSEDSMDTVELFVRKKSGSKIENLNNYSKANLKILEKELANKQNANISETYKNNYNFIYLEYEDLGHHLLEYCTIINNDAYTVTIQKENEYTKEEKKEIKKIIDSMIFEVEASEKVKEKKDSWNLDPTIIGAISGAVAGLFVYLRNRKKITI